VYEIRWGENVRDDMRHMGLRAYEVRQITDAVDEQLAHEPNRTSRRKKVIRPEEHLPYEHLEPVWQLRVGEFRVFYDIAACEPEAGETGQQTCDGVVSIRAIRRKPGHKTTREIL
jgi:mRNA-degrading endonuclease RelE of RelBE toxin-antitoxin system